MHIIKSWSLNLFLPFQQISWILSWASIKWHAYGTMPAISFLSLGFQGFSLFWLVWCINFLSKLINCSFINPYIFPQKSWAHLLWWLRPVYVSRLCWPWHKEYLSRLCWPWHKENILAFFASSCSSLSTFFGRYDIY